MKKINNTSEYSVNFRVRSYEVDATQKTNISTICNYFQEAAGLHAQQLNFDISQLQESGNTWVLYKMHVKADQLPKRWETVTIRTRPSSGDGLRAFRDYELFDGQNNRLACAISQWMVLDMKSKRPVRMPREIMEMGLNQKAHTIEPDKTPIKPGKPDGTAKVASVGLHDLDMNNHVNNVRYIEWMTGYIPPSKTNGLRCIEIEIQYLSEAVFGDDIFHSYEKQSTPDGLKLHHTLYSGPDKKPIAASFSVWS